MIEDGYTSVGLRKILIVYPDGMRDYVRPTHLKKISKTTLEQAAKIVRKAIKAEVDKIGPQLTDLENQHIGLVERRMSLVTALAVIDGTEEN